MSAAQASPLRFKLKHQTTYLNLYLSYISNSWPKQSFRFNSISLLLPRLPHPNILHFGKWNHHVLDYQTQKPKYQFMALPCLSSLSFPCPIQHQILSIIPSKYILTLIFILQFYCHHIWGYPHLSTRLLLTASKLIYEL